MPRQALFAWFERCEAKGVQATPKFAADTWAAQRRTFAQMFQFWRCLTNELTHHPVGRAVADYSLFRGQSYHALSGQDAAWWG